YGSRFYRRCETTVNYFAFNSVSSLIWSAVTCHRFIPSRTKRRQVGALHSRAQPEFRSGRNLILLCPGEFKCCGAELLVPLRRNGRAVAAVEDRISLREGPQEILKGFLTGLAPGFCKNGNDFRYVGIYSQKFENEVLIRVERMMQFRHLLTQQPINLRPLKH